MSSFLSDPNGTIRRRKPTSQRRHDGLIRFGHDSTSQSGEDGVIQRLFDLIPPQQPQHNPYESHHGRHSDTKECKESEHNNNNKERIATRWCVDIGAWDGKHLSNTYSLLCNSSTNPKEEEESKLDPSTTRRTTTTSTSWKGVLVEADADKFQQLKALHDPFENTCLNVTVSCHPHSTQSLSYILKNRTPNDFPNNFELIIIDVDGTDYWLMHDLLKANFRPQVICVEFNPSMPDDLIYIPPRDDTIRQGTSLSALVELGSKYSYQLCETTCYNAFFVDLPLYHQYVKKDIPFDPTIERLHEVTMGTHLYQLYDGKLKISGCKKLLWHRIPILEENIQALQNEADRSFPFVPGASSTCMDDDFTQGAMKQKLGDTSQSVPPDDELEFFKSISIDMSSYCQSLPSPLHPSDRKRCSKQLLDTLKQDGFALVRGTGISKKTCQDALKWSHEFLQEAPEAVRRSCLTKDRARRGYSPQNAENFASLIGEKGPNDLVKKFRVGPKESGGEHFSLMQSNAWPSECNWEHSKTFQNCIEAYYDEICDTAHAIVSSICDGLISTMNEFSKCFDGSAIERDSHTSILTMLGYRKGARHQGCKKPLVAAHTDVGVVTVLLFDRGSVATLQKLEDDNWIDVKLPNSVPQDPIFVVNIGDCLSELCNSEIPSTMHRVMPERGTIPRNSLALFVGFRPDQILEIGGKRITYEEWRKQKIKKAQQQQQMQKKECSK